MKSGAVPSIFCFTEKDDPQYQPPMEESPRSKRFKRRSEYEQKLESVPEVLPEFDYQYEAVLIEPSIDSKEDHKEDDLPQNKEIQCEIPGLGKFGIDSFQYDDKTVNYYTGFDDYDHFMLFFHCLGPVAYDLEYKCALLDPKDQLFMTLMKLRQAKDDLELAMLFKISESTVSRIVIQWINFLYFYLKDLEIWPSKDIIEDTMPADFKKKFPNTRVILDATEVTDKLLRSLNC